MDAEIVDAFHDGGWVARSRPLPAGRAIDLRASAHPTGRPSPTPSQGGGRRLGWFKRQTARVLVCGHRAATMTRSANTSPRALPPGRNKATPGPTPGADGYGRHRSSTGQTTCQLALSNHRLIAGARELALSLGYKAGRLRRKRTNLGTEAWILELLCSRDPVFRLRSQGRRRSSVVDRPNSATRWRTIVDVRPIEPRSPPSASPSTAPTTCTSPGLR